MLIHIELEALDVPIQRDRIRIYNTCVSHGPYQDYHAWREGRTGELAKDLLAHNIKAMKIWPFDQFGVPTGGPLGRRAGAGAVGPVGYYLKREDLKKGISYVEDIRKTVGDKIEALGLPTHVPQWHEEVEL